MTNEEFDTIMEGTVKELATQQSWLDKQKENVDHIYKLLRELKELEGQLRREREERVLERDVLEKRLDEATQSMLDNMECYERAERLFGLVPKVWQDYAINEDLALQYATELAEKAEAKEREKESAKS